jgi:hypothetical protein
MRAKMPTAVVAAALLAVGVTAAADASASCRQTEVLDVYSACLTEGCPPGDSVVYHAHMRNNASHKLFLTYRFNRPDGALIRGGFALGPKAEIVRPIGLGPTQIPEDKNGARLARLRVVECGRDESIQWRWR